MARRTFDRAAFFATLDATRISRGLSWRQVADETGISASTFTRLGNGHAPELDAFGVLCAWLSITPTSFFGFGVMGASAGPARWVSEIHSDPALSPTARVALGKVVVGAYEALKDLP